VTDREANARLIFVAGFLHTAAAVTNVYTGLITPA